tara:strand:+ start:765 stop:968 length:204 start_codon:yes stop_codon:yes gene_type:complete
MTTEERTNQPSKKPTHTVFANTYINGRPVNIRVGAAWKHSKGSGFNISLDSLVAFENKPNEEQPTQD